MVKNELKLRRQLSQLMVSTVINEFDYVVEEKIFGVDVVHFIEDCVFGMQVIA